MAFRIHEHIVKGELCNRERGRVTGRIWLAGCAKPLILHLSGNCHRDLAGCALVFKNPVPVQLPGDIKLNNIQRGVVGDITASRKVRVYDVPVEEAVRLAKLGLPVPEHKANSLYLEWYSRTNGRIVIESVDYEITISEPAWTLSPDEERRQFEDNAQAFQGFFQQVTEGITAIHLDPDENDAPLDEFQSEKLLKESDAISDKLAALMEKYLDHPDLDEIIDREMGWDKKNRSAFRDIEREAMNDSIPLEPYPLTEGKDWVRRKDGDIHHPLTGRVLDEAVKMWRYCNRKKLLADGGDTDLLDMVVNYQTLGAKLAGALDGLGYDDDLREPGFIIACLKRALRYLNLSIEAAAKTAAKQLLPARRLATFRKEQFAIREEILALMKRFREAS